MGTFFGIVLILTLIVVIAINVVGFVKDIKEKKRAKRQKLEEQEKQEVITEGQDNACSLYDCYPEVDRTVEEQEQRKDV